MTGEAYQYKVDTELEFSGGTIIANINTFSDISSTPKAGLVDASRQIIISPSSTITVVSSSGTPTLYSLALTNADTEYSQVLPSGTKRLEYRCRDSVDTRFAWLTGKVATPTDPYRTLLANEVKSEGNISLSASTIFFASGTAGVTMEIEAWQ